ncbi:hypothetical protein V2J09_003180 [Rumex salicifolius]
MVEVIAATSFSGLRPLCGGCFMKDIWGRQKPVGSFRLLPIEFSGKIVVSLAKKVQVERSEMVKIRARAMELTKEAFLPKEQDRTPRKLGQWIDTDHTDKRLGAHPPSNPADNPSLNNPLLRQERLSCGWLSAIFEWEGVIVEHSPDLENQAWVSLAKEEGKSPPLAFVLKRIEGMKTEQAISEVLCWSRDPPEMKRLASRKEEIYQSLEGGICRLRSGSQEFVNALMSYNIPMAVISTRPRKALETAIGVVGVEGCFNEIVAAEDVHRGKPDPEMFEYACQLLKFIPERCIVFGNSNKTVEAAHEARMKCVAVASKHPVYELSAADLIVRRLDELSIVDLKNLADLDSPEFQSGQLELETEMEEESGLPSDDDGSVCS